MAENPTNRSWSLAALLAALAMLGTFSVDMYLPAFPAIGRDLHAPPLAVQQTLSSYLLAYAFMMLWHGALSDALGRRPVILAGLAAYAAATLGCALSGTIGMLWLFRTVQGLAAGGGLAVGRAIVRDCFNGAEAQRLMSQITLVFSIAPALAPVIGGSLLNLLGWRWIFGVLFLVVAALTAWAFVRLPETLPRGMRQSLHPRLLWRNYVMVLTRPEFLLLTAMTALNFAGFFIYIAAAPVFLMDRLGVTTWGFAWLFVPMIGGVMLGALTSGRLAGRVSPPRTIGFGFAIMGAAIVINLLICAVLPPRPLWNVAPIMIFTVGSSLVNPSATLLMLELFPGVRGLTSSLQSFVQFALAAVNAAVIAPLLAASLTSLALGMAAFGILGAVAWLLYLKRRFSGSLS